MWILKVKLLLMICLNDLPKCVSWVGSIQYSVFSDILELEIESPIKDDCPGEAAVKVCPTLS